MLSLWHVLKPKLDKSRITEHDPSLQVLWDNVDLTGFANLAFNRSSVPAPGMPWEYADDDTDVGGEVRDMVDTPSKPQPGQPADRSPTSAQ